MFKEKNGRRNEFIIIAFALMVINCAPANRLLSGLIYKSNLTPLNEDKRILFENGIQEKAEKIRLVLDSCIEITQKFYGLPFEKDIYITLSATQKSHVKRCGDYEKSRGMVNWGRVFISPLAFSSNTYKSILVHELTHLHTVEKIGIIRYVNDIPAWFSEGVSVYVSNGAGAESYTDSAAIHWMMDGKHFNPTNKGSILKTSGYISTLPWQVFYRQSKVFVNYLIEIDSSGFKNILKDIEQGAKFRIAFKNRLKKTPEEIFKEFLNDKKGAKNSS